MECASLGRWIGAGAILVLAACSSESHTSVAADSGVDGAIRAEGGPDAELEAGSHDANDGSSGPAAEAGIPDSGAVETGPADGATAPLDWYPGYYGQANASGATNAVRDTFLTGPNASAFTGVEMIYPWSQCEATMGDYSGCFTLIDADLSAAQSAGKKIIVMLQYKAFGAAPAVVPAYLLATGAWCVTTSGGPLCGAYPSANGEIAMLWNTAVADRLHAWFNALSARYGPGGAGASLGASIAGLVLPETACGQNTTNSAYTFAAVGYTPNAYLAAVEANLQTLATGFPTKPVWQYINYIFGPADQGVALMTSLGMWALSHPNVGLGCPDVGGNATFHPAGYDVLLPSTFHGLLPFNVAIESMDYDMMYTDGLMQTWQEATGPAPNGMAAQFVVWSDVTGTGHAFTTAQAATFLTTHADPNTAPPMY